MKIEVESTLGQRARNILSMKGKGIVIAVFSNSFYCRLDTNDLLLFHQSDYGVVPFGLGFKDLESIITMVKPTPGMDLTFYNFNVLFPEHAINIIPIRGSELDERVPEIIFSEEIFTENLSIAENILLNRKGGIVERIIKLLENPRKGTEIKRPLNQNISSLWEVETFKKLRQGMDKESITSIGIILDKIIGLGTGLTPTMDDVLLGFAYIISFLERNGTRVIPSSRTFLKMLKDKAGGLTTEISSAYLRSAALGEEYFLLEKVSRSLLSIEKNNELQRNIDALLNVGSDSGGNMLVGMLMGLCFR